MFLPINKADLTARNIEQLDFVYVTGDAYVDHPSFGTALISRLVESRGFSVGIVAQPTHDGDYTRLGRPRLGFLVGSGVVDSMVNNYTVAKKRRKEDVYSEGGVAGKRPDRALSVYCRALKRIYPDVAIIAGGVEASLRRFAHYDYWADDVLPSVMCDAPADLVVYGMGEKPFFDILELVKKGVPVGKIKDVRGTAYLTTDGKVALARENFVVLPSFDEVKTDKVKYIKAFKLQSENTDPLNGFGLVQEQSADVFLVQNPPQFYLSEAEMDNVYALPYERAVHPVYIKGVPAIAEVEFSITSQRGCFGNCSFCAIAYHQGRRVHHRSKDSIVAEAKLLTEKPNFKGYIHDIGGPSANFYQPSCEQQDTHGMCKNRQCIGNVPCKNLRVSHTKYVDILRAVRALPRVKRVFVRSGVRFDYALMDKDRTFLRELVKYHVSGQLKVAPEHAVDKVLKVMNKPQHRVYEEFCRVFKDETAKAGLKQYVVPYLISSHPGCELKDAVKLAEYLRDIGYRPEQVQDFYPTPSTKATTMYYTGLDVATLRPVYVAKTAEDKAMQRALLQYTLPQNYYIVRAALIKAGRQDLIGTGSGCLIRIRGGKK
jgi:uncharacterized radical SAM protein YgiQ